MITLLISIAALLLGYIFYGRFVEWVFKPNANRPTPAYSKQDGQDFVPMPTWKVIMIQFLNIAGTGPIFGAIMGAMFGPSCYLWIVFGCVFGGAVHDYFSGMFSIRGDGVGVPNIIGHFMGNGMRKFMLGFTVFLLLMVGAVFVYSPASILGSMTGGTTTSTMIWVFVVLAYYVVATLVPVDKIIGKIYPVFAVAMIFMAISLLACLLIKWPSTMPEIWDGLQNRNPASGTIFPCMFISIACGAISGFHSTQCPLMARCVKNEKLGRPVFYGSMILEGIVALIWASVASYFFYGGGAEEMNAVGVDAAPSIVTIVSKSWLGTFGAILAMLGVVAAPITSGDTALRSARLIIADALHMDQKPLGKRLLIAIPIFAVSGFFLWFNISNKDGFEVIWRYFSWANQTLSIITLLAISLYISSRRKGGYFIIALIPACFMIAVCLTFILTNKIGLNLPDARIPSIAIASFAISLVTGLVVCRKRTKTAELNRCI